MFRKPHLKTTNLVQNDNKILFLYWQNVLRIVYLYKMGGDNNDRKRKTRY